MTTTGADAGPAADELQFDRALPADASAAGGAVVCSGCHRPVADRYYQVGAAVTCAACKDAVERMQGELAARWRGARGLLRAFGLGLGAAVAGAAIYFGVIAITKWELALVALLIGWMVGWAVRRGSGGLGGRRYQVLALSLTYFSVGLAYTPLAFKAIAEGMKKPAATATSAGAPARGAATAPPAAVSTPAATPAPAPATTPAPAARTAAPDTGAARAGKMNPAAAVGILLLLVVVGSLVLPVVYVIGTLPSGLLSAVIIGVGMHQAWKMTRAQAIPITGPYEVGAAPAAPASQA